MFTVFVASSTRAKPLAAPLASLLQERAEERNLKMKVRPWWRETFNSGVETLSALIRECQECHFAIILLTKDDVQLGEDQKEHLKPRDNCILEAGLFTGALDLKPERCFLVVSVSRDDLPSDLMGLTRIQFQEPKNLGQPNKCEEAVLEVADRIIKSICRQGYFDRPRLPLLSRERLLQDERSAEDGGVLLDSADVFVNSAHPLEQEDEFADQVLDNIRNGCKYRYFFHGNEEALSVIVRLLQSIVGAKLGGGNSVGRIEKMRQNPQKVKENISHLKQRLRIYFVGDTLFQCCIHNAKDPNTAICYLRYPRKNEDQNPPPAVFVKWFTDTNAFRMAGDLIGLYKAVTNKKRELTIRQGIFRSTSEFDLFSMANKRFRERVLHEARTVFPDWSQIELEEFCFGSETQQIESES